MQAVRTIKEKLIKYFDENVIETYYVGIRNQVAIELSYAPNSEAFHVAWNEIGWSTNGWRIIAE